MPKKQLAVVAIIIILIIMSDLLKKSNYTIGLDTASILYISQ